MVFSGQQQQQQQQQQHTKMSVASQVSRWVVLQAREPQLAAGLISTTVAAAQNALASVAPKPFDESS